VGMLNRYAGFVLQILPEDSTEIASFIQPKP
jgi:hypothetical protein